MIKYATELEQRTEEMTSTCKESQKKSNCEEKEACFRLDSDGCNRTEALKEQAQTFSILDKSQLDVTGSVDEVENLMLLHSSLKDIRNFLRRISTVDANSSDLAILQRLCKKLKSASCYKDVHQISNQLEDHLENKKLFIVLQEIFRIARAKARILSKNFSDEKKLLAKKIKKFKKERMSERTSINLDLKEIHDLNVDVRSKFCSRRGTLEERSSLNSHADSTHFSNKNTKSEFYSLCLSIKFGISAKKLSQTVPISQIYEKAKSFDLHPRNWFYFIHRELNNSNNWSHRNPVGRTSTLKKRNWESFVAKLN